MRLSSALFASFVTLSIALGSCSKEDPKDADPFATLQACYDEHHGGSESLPIQQAIVTCCLDHPIGGMAAPTCLDNQADCETHVRMALPAIAAADVTAACTTYITDKHQ